jgi:hypothetical protein
MGGDMEITLKIDYQGKPYIELFAGDYGDDTCQDLLELFIREAKEKGLVIVNEDSLEGCDTYASIRIKGNEKTR